MSYDKTNADHYTLEEDYIIEVSCEDCGAIHETSEELEECPSCGSEDLLNETSHEGIDCDGCGHTFEMWEDWYAFDGSTDHKICKTCYESLEG